MSDHIDAPTFQDLELAPALLKALSELGYETPSPIQQQSIPHVLAGADLLGQAQTGTGKTAAFALPLLSRVDLQSNKPQVLVLTPTRELAIQVAEAFQSYARYLKGFHVLPLYGGQSYDGQLRQLKRGAQVVVGTPGRMMDHMRRGTLKLDNLQSIVLDEADEMLRMGFIDDVEWILEQAPSERQTALFSATMPKEIARVAQRYLEDPVEVKIAAKTTTAKTIRQRYWLVEGLHKLDALTRLLEVETMDGMIIFVRTKTSTVELAEKLTARGYACDALNGDIPQNQRERTVERLKAGKLDIVVATDVAARGLDVERISHVVNYDIPYDTEAYVHRIGRTGRAGRNGEAILFVARRERRLLKAIERATSQPIEPMEMPSVQDINQVRIKNFKERITATAASKDLSFYQQLVEEYIAENEMDPIVMASALASMAQGEMPLLLKDRPKRERSERDRDNRSDRDSDRKRRKQQPRNDDVEMERFRIDVGYEHGVKPGNIVGAIANEADIDSQYIGQIEIKDECSFVDLPAGMPDDVYQLLRNTRVCQQKMNLTRCDADAESSAKDSGREEKRFNHKKKAPGKKPADKSKKFKSNSRFERSKPSKSSDSKKPAKNKKDNKAKTKPGKKRRSNAAGDRR